MNNSNSGSGFSSGYTGGFLGMNKQQQNPGAFWGVNRNHRQAQVSINSARLPTDQVQSPRDMKSLVENERPVGLRERDSTPRGFTMTFGKEKIPGTSNVMSNGAINFDDYSSDEDDQSMEDGNGGGAKGKKDAPWQRMKWTDNVVRLLIQVVASVGEDGCLEGHDGVRRKSGVIKKGKWKTVSKILISKGYHVSPQQCEDKFNDLNKRYKKLNDILGRGTSCEVVENPGLLENMHHLSAKAKEDVKKLLGSKHLFYREICAYHNGQKIPDCNDLELSIPSKCVAERSWNHSDGSPVAVACSKDKDCSPVAAHSKDNNVSGEDAEESDESDDDVSEDVAENIASGSMEKMGEYGNTERVSREVGNTRVQYGRQDSFQAEIAKIFNDPTKSQWERREWIKKRMLQLEEERIDIQAEALELEKRRLKWQRFCNKKELELDMARLEKERLMLDNKRKTLQLRQKEVEIEFRRPEASFNLTSFSIDITRRRDQL